MNAIGGSRVSKWKRRSRKAVRPWLLETRGCESPCRRVEDDARRDAAALGRRAGSEVGRVHAPDHQLVRSAFLILIREGLEALLVVAAIIVYLVKSGNRRLVRWIYLGVVAGLAASGVIAACSWRCSVAADRSRRSWKACARSWRWACCCTPATGCSTNPVSTRGTGTSGPKPNRRDARIGGTAGTDPTPERLAAAGIVSLALLSFLRSSAKVPKR